MYHTYFYLRRLSPVLEQELSGTRLMACWSGQKDVLHLEFFRESGDWFWVKADLSQGRALVSFPPPQNRSRGPSADLFPKLIGAVVRGVRQTPMDRSFHVDFANGLSLCFKLYGQRSNLLLHNETQVLDVFNHHLKKDLENPVPAGSEPKFTWHPDSETRKRLNPTFSARLWQAWEKRAAEIGPAGEADFLAFIRETETAPFFLCRDGEKVFLSFFPLGDVLEETADPLDAANRLSRLHWTVTEFEREKKQILGGVESQLGGLRNQLLQLEKQAREAEESRNYRLQADVLMAYGHNLPAGSTVAVLPDFSGENTLEIRLKRDLSVVENAERLYRKARGQQQDLDRILHRMEEVGNQIREAEKVRAQVEQTRNWPELKPYRKPELSGRDEGDSLPFRKEFVLGFEVWIGKNDKSNDALLRMAHKDDLWFHARDCSGSHVLIRTRKGQNTPQPVKERAASWAAYHSKARSEKLVPVMMTERKYVRKGKNQAAGQVRVEREKTVLAEPRA